MYVINVLKMYSNITLNHALSTQINWYMKLQDEWSIVITTNNERGQNEHAAEIEKPNEGRKNLPTKDIYIYIYI